jgi:hypothetical protein
MASGPTYTPIVTYTIPSAVTSYTFSSIPQTYTDLVVVGSFTNGASGYGACITFNGDTGTNYIYSNQGLLGLNSGALSYENSGQGGLQVAYNGAPTGTPSPWIFHINNYSNTATNKTVLSRFGSGDYYETNLFAGLYRSTSAITSIRLTPDLPLRTTFSAGSTFTIYGIAAA